MSEAIAVAAAPAVDAGGDVSMDALAALVPDPVSNAPENVADASDAARVAPAETEPAVEPEVEAAPAPEEAEADGEALKRAEAAAKRAREGSRRYREMREAQERSQAEVQRAAREAAQYRAQVEEAQRLRESLTKDPYKALKNLGMTDQALAERALREGTPEAALHEMNERLAAERAAREALETRLQSERQAQARQKAEADFTRVADNETSYPRLAQLNAGAQLVVARAALQQIADNGYEVSGLTDAQVAEACERFLAPKRAAKAAAAKVTPVVLPKPALKTLTNAVATERAVTARPWHELSDDEQIAQIAASIPDPS